MAEVFKAFISYSAKDRKLAKKFKNSLEEFGCGVYTSEDIKASMPAWEQVEDYIKASNCLIPLLTPAGASSALLTQEIGYAKAIDKPIIPFVEKGTTPIGYLYDLGWVEFDRERPSEAIERAAIEHAFPYLKK